MKGFLGMVLFGRADPAAHVEPLTHMNVAPAGRDEEKERQLKEIHRQMAKSRVNNEIISQEIRRELAGNVLRIVSGE